MMKMQQAAGTFQQREEGLTRNCLDSIAHALAHFSANHSDDYGFHNQKWAILSVAHATEAFCNLLLLAIDPGHPNGPKYPDLGKAINRLKGVRSAKLSNSERRALKNIFPGLEKQRNELMHRLPPPKLDMEQTALALLVLLYLILTVAPRAAGGAKPVPRGVAPRATAPFLGASPGARAKRTSSTKPLCRSS